MSQPILAEIRIFAGNFAPRGWQFCNGQLLQINQNAALFSLLGTTYGGNGTTTFALPDMRSRLPMHWGNGAGLTPTIVGEKQGSEAVQINATNLPIHTHNLQPLCNTVTANTDQTSPIGNYPGSPDPNNGGYPLYAPATDGTKMSQTTSTNTGGNQAHSNLQPYVALNFIIATVGTYPSRN